MEKKNKPEGITALELKLSNKTFFFHADPKHATLLESAARGSLLSSCTPSKGQLTSCVPLYVYYKAQGGSGRD